MRAAENLGRFSDEQAIGVGDPGGGEGLVGVGQPSPGEEHRRFRVFDVQAVQGGSEEGQVVGAGDLHLVDGDQESSASFALDLVGQGGQGCSHSAAVSPRWRSRLSVMGAEAGADPGYTDADASDSREGSACPGPRADAGGLLGFGPFEQGRGEGGHPYDGLQLDHLEASGCGQLTEGREQHGLSHPAWPGDNDVASSSASRRFDLGESKTPAVGQDSSTGEQRRQMTGSGGIGAYRPWFRTLQKGRLF